MEYITVSSKGQISIPKALREKLRLRQGTKLQIQIEDNGRIVLVRTADSLRRANRVARLALHARLRAELPLYERLYLLHRPDFADVAQPETAAA